MIFRIISHFWYSFKFMFSFQNNKKHNILVKPLKKAKTRIPWQLQEASVEVWSRATVYVIIYRLQQMDMIYIVVQILDYCDWKCVYICIFYLISKQGHKCICRRMEIMQQKLRKWENLPVQSFQCKSDSSPFQNFILI